MAAEKILIIEDEESIQELIKYNLQKEGFSKIKVCDTAEIGFKTALEFAPDLILLDLMLPGMDGLSLCRLLKESSKTIQIPVIMITAKSQEDDIIAGLEAGADDYIPKPFSPKVLIARIKSVLRRYCVDLNDDKLDERVIKCGKLTMDRGRRQAILDDEILTLTYSEFEILFLLSHRPGMVFSRAQIVNEVKGDDYPVTERSIDVQIVGLRKKLGSYGNMIETVRGVGYRLNQVD